MQRPRNRKIIEDEEEEGKQSLQKSSIKQNKSSVSKSTGGQNCAICWCELSDITAMLPCSHRFCHQCLEQFLMSHFNNPHRTQLNCPLCRGNFQNYIMCNKQQGIFQPFHIFQIESESQSSSHINSSSLLSSSYLSTSMFSSSSENDCIVCYCNENMDQMVTCRNCQSVIGHTYCLPQRILVERICQSCLDEIAEEYRTIQ